MIGVMRHRGPDDEGVWASQQPGVVPRTARGILGACRLAILDLSPLGHQPLIDPSTGSTIVFNGEIYNFGDLRRSLVADGVELRSHSDTEVVLQLYLKHGASCLPLLEGMFALAIWDTRSEALFMARDRLGVKPLYLTERNGGLIFASEVRALLNCGAVDRTISVEGVSSYLRFGAVREPLTIIEGVRELPAGTWLKWTPGSTKAGQFWNIESVARPSSDGGPLTSTYVEAVQQVRKLILDGVRLRLTSDVPVVTFLSGGLDSTSVVAGVRAATGAAPDTIGVTFSEADYSEAPYIESVVKYYGCNHRDRRLTAEELLALIPEALKAMDQPTFDGINTYVVSRAAAEYGYKVALSGVGGDELFGGYPSFRYAPRLAGSETIRRHRPLRWMAIAAAHAMGRERGKKLRRWFSSQDVEGDAYDLVREVFSRSERTSLLRLSSQSAPRAVSSRRDRFGFGEVSRRELTDYLRNVLLRDTDCFGMACSLEIREPLLHTRLIEHVLAIPDRWKMHGPGPKPLLVAAMGNMFPEAIRTRPKHGFTLPFDLWLRSGALREEVRRTLSAAAGDGRLLSLQATTAVWDEFEQGRTSWNRVWALYVLRKWVDANVAGA